MKKGGPREPPARRPVTKSRPAVAVLGGQLAKFKFKFYRFPLPVVQGPSDTNGTPPRWTVNHYHLGPQRRVLRNERGIRASMVPLVQADDAPDRLAHLRIPLAELRHPGHTEGFPSR